jgi:murein DD-endopeptidase MepM/ murein hydrolase activator NlpD
LQIILVSRHLKAARTITIMPRHLVLLLFGFVFIVMTMSAFFSWLSVQLRLPVVEEMIVSVLQRESQKTQDYLSNNLQLMATRVGELQAQVLQLDSLGDRVSGLAGMKRESAMPKVPAGQGGPFIPALLTKDELQREIDRLAKEVDRKTDELVILESRLLERRVKNRLLPTTLPVQEASLGSPFGHRSDPIAGVRAMHEGIDFNAETGAPVMVAADGVVISAAFHPDFGNVIDVDHGEGLISRYAHLSRMAVTAGELVKRGQLIGAVGSTGRSTGAHLHFEVRLLGVAQNPAHFLKQDESYAQLKRR